MVDEISDTANNELLKPLQHSMVWWHIKTKTVLKPSQRRSCTLHQGYLNWYFGVIFTDLNAIVWVPCEKGQSTMRINRKCPLRNAQHPCRMAVHSNRMQLQYHSALTPKCSWKTCCRIHHRIYGERCEYVRQICPTMLQPCHEPYQAPVSQHTCQHDVGS